MFPTEVHLDQRVSYKVSEAAAVKVAVRVGVVLAVVYLRELQTPILVKVFPVEVLMGTVDLQRENELAVSEMNCGQFKSSTFKGVVNVKS